MTTLEQIQGMSLRKIERRYYHEGPFELINGEIMPPTR